MTRIRLLWRSLRFRWCRMRGHQLGISSISFAFSEPDRMLDDGTILQGSDFQFGPTCCKTCGYRS